MGRDPCENTRGHGARHCCAVLSGETFTDLFNGCELAFGHRMHQGIHFRGAGMSI